MSKFRAKSFVESMNFAVHGLVYAFSTQRNLRVHLAFAVLVVLFATALDLPNVELALLALAIGMVIACEMGNTALEAVVDLITQEYQPLAKVAKDVAAGAVLVASTGAAAVGYFVFFERLANLHQDALARTIAAPAYLTFLALLVVLVTVVAMKLTGGPARIQGGMPSAHTAAAASLATSIFFVSHSGIAAVLAAVMALLVAESRVEARIHTSIEVVVGGLIGILITVLAFQLIR